MDVNVANGFFPNKEAILLAMGFTELPVQPGVLQMLYYIISNSCWFDDILLRYMPKYRQDLMLGFMMDPHLTIGAVFPNGGPNLTHEVFDNPYFSNSFYSYDRYLQCALIEYNKLLRYMYHCTNKGLSLDNFCGELRVCLVSEEKSPNSGKCSPTEKGASTLVSELRSQPCATERGAEDGLRPSLGTSLLVDLFEPNLTPEVASLRSDKLRFSINSEEEFDVLRTSNNEGRSPELFEPINSEEDFYVISLNKQKIRSIMKTRSTLLFYKNEILKILDIIKSNYCLDDFTEENFEGVDFSHAKSVEKNTNNEGRIPVRDPSTSLRDVEDFSVAIVRRPLRASTGSDQGSLWADKNLLTTKVEDRSETPQHPTRVETPTGSLTEGMLGGRHQRCLLPKVSLTKGVSTLVELFVNLRRPDVGTLHQHIQHFENIIESANKKLKHLRMLQKNSEDLELNLENLQKYKLIDDLNMRSVEFCAPHLSYWSHYGPICFSEEKFYKHIPIGAPQFVVKGEPSRMFNVSMLPTELIRIISSYVGDDVLESVRRKSIMDRFFPTARDDVMTLLKQWRKADLINYYHQVFLRYRINFERNRWRRIPVFKTSKKDVLIENILDGNFKLTFYDFLRDVFILSRILNSRRRVRRTTRN